MTEKQIVAALTLVVVAWSWVAFAQHPTAANFRRALGRTLLA